MSSVGTNSKNPEVGLGVVGKNTDVIGPVSAFSSNSPLVAVEMNPIAQMPLRGYSIMQALSKLVSLWANTVSAICLTIVDGAHHRHARDKAFTPPQEDAPNEALAHPADKHCEDQENDDADAAHVHFDPVFIHGHAPHEPVEKFFGLISVGHKGPHETVDPADDRPDKPQGQSDRGNDDQTGDKVIAQGRQNGAAWLWVLGLGHLGWAFANLA